MKNNKVKNVFAFIVSSYFALVTYMTFANTLKYICVVPILAIIFYVLIKKNYLEQTKIVFDNTNRLKKNREIDLKLNVIWFVIIVLGHSICWAAYYPGGFNLDAYGQWNQVHGDMNLNNWHPVFTTMIYWILTRIIDSLAFCILIQIVLFAVTILFLLRELNKWNVSMWILWGTVIWVSFNPSITTNTICLIKDVSFSMVIVWITICFLKIARTEGKCLNSVSGRIVLIILFLMALLIRHNAIFFVVPILVVSAFVFKTQIKSFIIVGFITMGMFFTIQGPLFSFLEVEQHSNVVGESVGIPMAAMANAFINNPENCPEEVKDYLLDIAEYKEWKKHYIPGEWDSCKWEFGGIDLLNDESFENIWNLFKDTIMNCADEVYFSIKENTRVVWQIVGSSDWSTYVYIEDNDYDIVASPNIVCRRIIERMLNISEIFPFNLFIWEIGPIIIIFLICILNLLQKDEAQKCVFTIALLLYDFLTMCLLCGPSFRYFYVNQILLIPLMGITFGGKYEENKGNN